MVTAVPQPLVAAWNMLCARAAARRAVAGMPELYARFRAAHPDAPFVYLSSGAWNTARTLRRFLARHGFPAGPLLLTDFGPTDTGWFRSGRVHKTTSLNRLMDTFPHVRWVLVGDDGQADPEIYAAAAKEHPDQVAAVVIRSLTTTERMIATAGAAKDDAGALWAGRASVTTAPHSAPVVVGRDGQALAAGLETIPGLLAVTGDAPA
jgi:phosphatidate phosphatase APP1